MLAMAMAMAVAMVLVREFFAGGGTGCCGPKPLGWGEIVRLGPAFWRSSPFVSCLFLFSILPGGWGGVYFALGVYSSLSG